MSSEQVIPYSDLLKRIMVDSDKLLDVFIRGNPDYVKTEDLKKGDLLTFWDAYGVFLGVILPTDEQLAASSDDEDVVSDVSVDLALSAYTHGAALKIRFLYKGENKYSTLQFTHTQLIFNYCDETLQRIKPENIIFLKLLIDGEIRLLPRVVHPYFFYDDKLRVVQQDATRQQGLETVKAL